MINLILHTIKWILIFILVLWALASGLDPGGAGFMTGGR